ncbi:hypothetical protein Dimus_039518 [Dionaea muscipula]
MDTNPLRVAVANGGCMISHAMCPNFSWTMNRKPFQADLKILDLGICDLVLGLDRMKQFNPITIDLNEFKISFIKDGKLCQLKGIKKRPGQLEPQKPKKLGKGAKGSVLCQLYLIEKAEEDIGAMAGGQEIKPGEQVLPLEV